MLGIALPATATDASSERLGTVDPNYDAEQTIRRDGAERRRTARETFETNPRESTLRFTLAPFRIFGMHGDLSDGDGWGMSSSLLVQANSDTPDFKFLIGGELLGFTAETESGTRKTEMKTLNLMLSVGAAYDFTPHLAVGALWGIGLIGATYFEEDFSDGTSDSDGTSSTVLSFKPYAEFMLNKNFSVYAAYRFVYVGSSLIAQCADWNDVETAAHGVEFGICYRF